mmetsp:Transcript_7031/g.14507  ORF Transcript_7031/g.14507 Transcript_7031/m.14507 type:complete len:200 (-) Transcript_7031:386-985(-)
MEEDKRDCRRKTDAHPGCKSLQNIVGILDDGSHKESTTGLQTHQDPRPKGKSVKIVQVAPAVVTRENSFGHGNDNRKKGQLDVSHPHTDGLLLAPSCRLDDLFEIDSRQCARQTSNRDGTQSQKEGLSLCCLLVFFFLLVGFLVQDDNGHTQTQSHQTHPLLNRILAIQHNDTDNSRRDQLRLVGDLKEGRRQIGQGYI